MHHALFILFIVVVRKFLNQMEKVNEHTLLPEFLYTIGKFKVLLNENTGHLRVTIHTNDNLKVQPKSDNSIVIEARNESRH